MYKGRTRQRVTFDTGQTGLANYGAMNLYFPAIL